MRRVVCLLTLLVVPAACGGGNDPGDDRESNGPPAGRASYIARADAACAEGAAAHPEIAESFRALQAMSPDDPGFRREAATHFRKVAAVAKDFTDDFAAIEPPEDDRERIAEFNAANEEAIGRLDALVAALESNGDPSDELQSYTEALAKADRLGEAYGFEVCAQIPEG